MGETSPVNNKDNFVIVECVFEESLRSSIAKVPGSLRVGEATGYLLDKYKRTQDPDAAQFTLRVPREGGGYLTPTDPTRTIASLVARHSARNLRFQKITRKSYKPLPKTISTTKRNAGGFFDKVNPMNIDSFIKKYEVNMPNELPVECLLKAISQFESCCNPKDETAELLKPDIYHEDVELFKSGYRAAKPPEISADSGEQAVYGIMAFLLREVFPEGLMPSSFVDCCDNKDRQDLMPALIANLVPFARSVLRRLVLMLVNLKHKERAEMQTLYKRIAECIYPKTRALERSRSANRLYGGHSGNSSGNNSGNNSSNNSSSNIFTSISTNNFILADASSGSESSSPSSPGDDKNSKSIGGGESFYFFVSPPSDPLSGSGGVSSAVASESSARTVVEQDHEYLAECEKLLIELADTFSHCFLDTVALFPGERVLTILDNMWCFDKYNFLPPVLSVGELWITNHRFIYTTLNTLEETNIPIMAILSLAPIETTKYTNMDFYEIMCKDLRWKVFGFTTMSAASDAFKAFLDNLHKQPLLQYMLAFHNVLTPSKASDDVSLETDYKRMKVDSGKWRVVQNGGSRAPLCASYPVKVVVPASVTDAIIKESAEYRAGKRFPILTWACPSSKASIFRSGTFGRATSGVFVFGSTTTPPPSLAATPPSGDEKLVRAIGETNSDFPRLNVFDTGGGPNVVATSFFSNCKFRFLRLPGIAELRENFDRLLNVHKNTTADPLTASTESWIEHLKLILRESCNIVDFVEAGESVLIQHSDCCDVDATLSCLAQLQLDPYYRTIEGFIMLVEKDWLGLGHPFDLRSCHEFMNKKSNSASFAPFFVQFVHAVWMMWQQNCRSFQFNEHFLIFLLDELYSCRFGTFLYNSDIIRKANSASFSRTPTVWRYVRDHAADFTNVHYERVSRQGNHNILTGVMKMDIGVVGDLMWNEYFYRYWYRDRENRYKAIYKIREGPNALELFNFQCLVFPDELYGLTKLKSLNVSKNLLNYIPARFCALTALAKLNMDDNRITFLTDDLILVLSQRLNSLTELRLDDNQITSIPPSMAQFTNLEILRISNNKLGEFPVGIGLLPNLRRLFLSGNAIMKFSNHFKFTKIQVLDLSRCTITEFSHTFAALPYLQELYMQENSITRLPQSLFSATFNLQVLNLNHNRLKELPPVIFSLVKLEELYLDCNEISALPNEITNLSKLRHLTVRDNRIEMLPPGLGHLLCLEYLDLCGNNIVSLPPAMGLLVNLKNLRLDLNKLKTPPQEIMAMELPNVLEYLRDMLDGSESCYRMKLMIVGHENVGKTTLLRCIRDKKKQPESENLSTDGIRIESFKINVYLDEYDEDSRKHIKQRKEVTLNVWDFAGQELYYTTHQFFLSDRSLYLLVYNVIQDESEAKARIDFWINSIKSRASGASIIIVGTHIDSMNGPRGDVKKLKKMMEDRYLNKEKYPNVAAVCLVSCITGKGINTLRSCIEEVVAFQKHMGEKLPRSYALLEKNVEDEKQKRRHNIPTVMWSEFLQWGLLHNIKGEKELLRATIFLHQLGTLIYFPNEPGLKDFVILNPQWITEMLATIITTKQTYARDGILPHANLKHIWKPPSYPAHLHPHLMTLLEKFEVTYNLSKGKYLYNSAGVTAPNSLTKSPSVGISLSASMPDIGGDHSTGGIEDIDESAKSLIPSLLPSNRPVSVAEHWGPYSPSIFQFGRKYEFEFVPNGFFSRLMVRILNYSHTEALCYWKHGILVSREREFVLLEIFPDQSMNFTVRGPNPASLSRDISDTIDSMISDFFKLTNVQVYVPCIHCISNKYPDPYLFPLEVCEEAARRQKPFVQCTAASPHTWVRTEKMVPDLAMTNFVGERILFSDLTFEAVLGEGGSAVVHQGRYKDLVVAIKRLKVPSSGSPEQMAEVNLSKAFNEFRRECWIMTGLEHPNIVGLKGLCMDPLCLVTEYLPHGDLYEFLHSDEAFDWSLRLKIALDIAAGMEFLHNSSPPIIHRDLKSPNILLKSLEATSVVVAKVADFGLSGLESTITGHVVQNPTWLAPELLEQGEFTMQSDVYAFGVILWELLTRKRYFEEVGGFYTLLEAKVIAGERPEIPANCIPAYARLIEDCWAQDLYHRPSFEEIAQRLVQMSETKLSSVLQITSPKLLSQYSSPETSSNNLLDMAEVLAKSGEKHPKVRSASESDTAIVVFTGVRQPSLASLKYNTEFLRVLEPKLSSSVQCMILVGNRVWCGCSDGSITVWNSETASCIRVLTAHQKKICTLFCNFEYVWSGSYDRHVHMWNTEDCTLYRSFPDFEVSCFAKVNTAVWGGCITGAVIIFDIRKKYNVREKIELGHGAIGAILALSSGSFVWVALDRNIVVMDSSTGSVIRVLKGHEKNIFQMVEADHKVWSGAADGVIRVWNAESGELVTRIEAHAPSQIFALMVDGQYVWSGGWDRAIKIWNTADYRCMKTHIEHQDGVSCFVLVKPTHHTYLQTKSNPLATTTSNNNSPNTTQNNNNNNNNFHSNNNLHSNNSLHANNNNNNNNNNNSLHANNNNNNNHNNNYSHDKLAKYVWSGSWDKSIILWSITARTLSNKTSPVGVFRNNSSPALTHTQSESVVPPMRTNSSDDVMSKKGVVEIGKRSQ